MQFSKQMDTGRSKDSPKHTRLEVLGMKVKSFQVSERGPIILLRFVTEQDDSENRWKSCKLPKQQSSSGYKVEMKQ